MFYKITAHMVYKISASSETQAVEQLLKNSSRLSSWKIIGEPIVEPWTLDDKMEDSRTKWSEFEPLLGKVPDVIIAEKAEVAVSLVHLRRNRLGIEPVKKPREKKTKNNEDPPPTKDKQRTSEV